MPITQDRITKLIDAADAFANSERNIRLLLHHQLDTASAALNAGDIQAALIAIGTAYGILAEPSYLLQPTALLAREREHFRLTSADNARAKRRMERKRRLINPTLTLDSGLAAASANAYLHHPTLSTDWDAADPPHLAGLTAKQRFARAAEYANQPPAAASPSLDPDLDAQAAAVAIANEPDPIADFAPDDLAGALTPGASTAPDGSKNGENK